jgi:hypothetical protein
LTNCPLTKPRTLCACHPAALMMDFRVAPDGCRRRARICSTFVTARLGRRGLGSSFWTSFQICRTAVLRSLNLRTGRVPVKVFQIARRRDGGYVAARLANSPTVRKFLASECEVDTLPGDSQTVTVAMDVERLHR